MEGGAYEGGKSESHYEHSFRDPATKGKYQGDRSPDVSSDFYHKYPEDIKMMKELGLKSFRFSFAWTRICPDISGKPNKEGIDFYHRVLDEMIAQGIEPLFDLFHSDIPQWVLDNGGLVDDRYVDWFTHYAEVCFREFGGKVKLWSTVNEPKLSVYGSYAWGRYAPYKKDPALALKATHNMVIAHYRSVKLLHEMWPDAKIGAVNNAGKCHSLNFDKEDMDAADRHFAMQFLFLDPMVLGEYPKEMMEYPAMAQYVTPEMVKQLKEEFVPMDFYGINYYNPNFIRKGTESAYGSTWFEAGWEKDAYGFPTYGAGMLDLLMELRDRYGDMPIYITENGYTYRRDVATMTVIGDDIHDKKRIDYIREHLRSVSRAIKLGINVKGYYYWSVMDCWEGTMGYGYPMGLISVNFDTLERTPRDSYYYYKTVIENNMVD
jgi:beta-glucosidase